MYINSNNIYTIIMSRNMLKKKYIIKNYNEGKPSIVDDFYGWVNYSWIRSNKIPDDETKYTHFIQTQLIINNHLREILENNTFPLASKLYNSYIDMSYRNENTLNELTDIINMVNKVQTDKELIIMCGKLLFMGVSTLFNISIDANVFISSENIFYIGQTSLGLPDREYYHNSKHSEIKKKYYETICLIYKEIYPDYSVDKINNIASILIDIESKLSIIFLSNADKRESEATYHKINYDNLRSTYPKLYLDILIETLCSLSSNSITIEHFSTILMEHKNDSTNYFKQLEILLDNYTLEQWKEYFKFHIMLAYINLTNKRMKEIHFEMFKKTIRGQVKPKSLWRSALSFACTTFNDPISRIYTEKFLNKDIELYMLDMVKNIKKATKERIKGLDWMSNETKTRALIKLKKMKLKIGYSKTKARIYPDINLTESIIKNTIIMNVHNIKYSLNKLKKPVDIEEWDLPSYVVNAYFNPTRNEILFPAAILNSPFLDLNKSDVYNYGNIGSVIGHEIIHGFDDQGAKFDENGSINDWWTTQDKEKYDSKVRHIIKLYENEGVNGKLTAGENIADFGAVVMPLYGLKYKLKRDLNNDDIREFFMGYASHWQYLITEKAAEERRLSDPHAFSDLRVNIPLKNSHEFHKVFKTKPGDGMYIKPEDRLVIW
jgi:putative endopeptidase